MNFLCHHFDELNRSNNILHNLRFAVALASGLTHSHDVYADINTHLTDDITLASHRSNTAEESDKGSFSSHTSIQ